MDKTKIIGSIIIIAVSFAFGRYTAPSAAIKTIETNQTDTETQKDTHKETTITKDKNGNEVTKIIEDSTTKKDKQSTTNIDQTVTPSNKDILNVSALVATDGFSLSNITPVYGLSVTKNLLGPITVGAFGLTNRTVGLSIGVNF